MITVSSNTLVLNEIKYIDGLIKNLLDANVDEIIFLDGGSTDGTYEKLIEYEKKCEKIKIIRWRQPINSEYKMGFREKDRRNIMMIASSSEYILYIDADERISINFKLFINSNHYKAIVIAQQQFWGSRIRVNTVDDRVWSPALQFRLVKKNESIKFMSNDSNGLHNYISINGFKVLGGFNAGIIKQKIARVYNFVIGFRTNICKDINIYHLHYLELEKAMKKNDLRKNDLENAKVVLVKSELEGLKYDRRKKHVICCLEDDKWYKEIKDYL